jgi:hypothetical protein
MMRCAASPFPNGLSLVRGISVIWRAAARIFSGFVPTRTLEPTSIVSGHSVLSRRVTQGTFKIQLSSWTPPESVMRSDAVASNMRNSRYPTGSITWIPSVERENSRTIFWVRGCMGKTNGNPKCSETFFRPVEAGTYIHER